MKIGNINFSLNLRDFYTLNWYKKDNTKTSGEISFTINVYPLVALLLVYLYFSKKK
jgi:hypothetical protein